MAMTPVRCKRRSWEGYKRFNLFFNALWQDLYYFRNYLDFFEGRMPVQLLTRAIAARAALAERGSKGVVEGTVAKDHTIRLLLAECYSMPTAEINRRLFAVGFTSKVTSPRLKRICDEMGITRSRGCSPQITAPARFEEAVKALGVRQKGHTGVDLQKVATLLGADLVARVAVNHGAFGAQELAVRVQAGGR